MTVPMYLAETAPPSMRGRLTVVNNLFITGHHGPVCMISLPMMSSGGQMVAGVVDGAFSSVDNGWRYMLGLAAVPAVIQFIGFLFLPESPRYLVSKGHIDKVGGPE